MHSTGLKISWINIAPTLKNLIYCFYKISSDQTYANGRVGTYTQLSAFYYVNVDLRANMTKKNEISIFRKY